MYGDALVWAGLQDEGINYIERGLRLSPISPHWNIAMIGNAQEMNGDLDLAISTYRKAKGIGEDTMGRVFLAAALIRTEQMEEAREVIIGILKIDPTYFERTKMWCLERPSEVVRQSGILKSIRR